MKHGKTTLTPGRNGFPPTVKVGSDDGAVNVYVGPVWIRVRSISPGDSYDVAVSINGSVLDRPAQSAYWNEFVVQATAVLIPAAAPTRTTQPAAGASGQAARALPHARPTGPDHS